MAPGSSTLDDKDSHQKLLDPDTFSDLHDDDDHERKRQSKHSYSLSASVLSARRSRRRRNLATLCLGLLPFMLFCLLYFSSSSRAFITRAGLMPNLSRLEKKPNLHHILPSAASRQMDPATGKFPPRKALVLSTYKHQNVKWIPDFRRLLPEWEIFRYESDATAAQLEDDYDNTYEGIETHRLSHSDGREPLAYLSFIRDNYATLPDYIVFAHGHRHSWHQPEHIVDVILALNLTAVDDEKYVNFRCATNHGCTEETQFYFAEPEKNLPDRGGNRLPPFWKDIMEPLGFGELPATMARRCCAQFAVSKAAILAHSPQFWEYFSAPITKRPLWGDRSARTIGLFYESLWHVVMGKSVSHCPSEDWCHNVHFQGALRCACDGNMPCNKYGVRMGWTNIPCQNDFRKVKLDSAWRYMKHWEEKYPPDGNITNPWEVEYPLTPP